MPQGALPFEVQAEKSAANVTGCAGLPVYMDLALARGHPSLEVLIHAREVIMGMLAPQPAG